MLLPALSRWRKKRRERTRTWKLSKRRQRINKRKEEVPNLKKEQE